MNTHYTHLCASNTQIVVMIRKNITITEEQAEWIDENHINLSSLVRECIDAKRGGSGNVD